MTMKSKTLLYTLSLLSILAVGFILMKGQLIRENEFGEEEEKESGAEIWGAFDQWSAMRAYPNKEIMAKGFSAAYQQSLRMSNSMKRLLNPNARTETTNPWTALAPMNTSGRITAIAFDPTNANTIYLGAASGG